MLARPEAGRRFMMTRVAVLFGGRSPEHDVSIATGLQALKAFDSSRFSPFPVYITPMGDWLVGDALREWKNFLPTGKVLELLQSVTVDSRPASGNSGRLIGTKSGVFRSPLVIEFDVAFLALHGHLGENGSIQGLFELANVPYTGPRLFTSAVYMNKLATKRLLEGTGVSLLPTAVLERPVSGLLLSERSILETLGDIKFPVIVKPMNLGSSIGASRATNATEVRSALPTIFKLDSQAILEPFVENLVEYNVSVRKVGGQIVTSAIEKPERDDVLLDFKTKYLSSGGHGGTKVLGTYNPGMLAMTRTLNPSLPPEVENKIRSWAEQCFVRANAAGVPRVDFLSNALTGEVWLNEVNSCPGSFGFFLWEAAKEPLLFTELISFLIDEALALHASAQIPSDPTTEHSRLFSRS